MSFPEKTKRKKKKEPSLKLQSTSNPPISILKKKRKTTEKKTSIMSLPHDLLLKCVSRLYYPTLSLLSKRFRSLLVSPELYKVRSLLGHTESCLYVCIGSSHDRNPRWFIEELLPCVGHDNNAVSFLRCKSACVDGKFHVKSYKDEVAFDSKEGRWDMVGRVGDCFIQPSVGNYLSTNAYCEIGNVLFCVYGGVIGWYDTEVGGEWRLMEGLVGLPKLYPRNSFRLADYATYESMINRLVASCFTYNHLMSL